MDKKSQARRNFLKKAAATTSSVVLAPGVILNTTSVAAQPRDLSKPVTDSVRWGMLIDTTICDLRCNDCVTSCQEEHGWHEVTNSRPDQEPQWIRKVHLKDKESGRRVSLPVMCQHCGEPPCVDVCPTGASMKRADGIVLVDKHICIGCRFCIMACPYKARSFVHERVENQRAHSPRGKGTVEACTLCVHLIDQGKQPVCAEHCKDNAILFGNLNDPTSAISQKVAKYNTTKLRPELELNQGVRYRGI